jgi:glycosyltransferase involved in cell wall biosynthesis
MAYPKLEAPLVSIIVPTYNRISMLRRALASLLGQTYPHIEIVVVDDGSTDGSREALSRLDDPRIRVVLLDQNMGPSAARNRGLEHASGHYLCFLDSDDEYLPEKIARQVRLLETLDDEYIGVECGSLLEEAGSRAYIGPSLAGADRASLLDFREKGGLTPTFMYRAEAIGGLRYNEDLPAYEDYDFVVQALSVGSVRVDDFPGVVIHHHDGERLQSPELHITALRRLYALYIDELVLRPSTHARWQFKLGRQYLRAGRLPEARDCFRLAANTQPGRVQYRVISGLSHLPGQLFPLTFKLYTRAAKLATRLGPGRSHRRLGGARHGSA